MQSTSSKSPLVPEGGVGGGGLGEVTFFLQLYLLLLMVVITG